MPGETSFGASFAADAANEGRLMAVNISAWSIRHPLPPIIMAVSHDGDRLYQLQPAAHHADAQCRCAGDIGHDRAIRRQPRGAESKVTKLIEDAVSSVTGAHHITSLITDGISNTTILFRLETIPIARSMT